MANVIIDESSLYAIADAIRDKLEVETTYKPSEMAEAIADIGSATLGTKTITSNGTYDAEDDSLDGYSEVTVSVSGGSPSGTKSITANGTGIDVAAYAYADVAVPNTYAAGDEGKVVSNGALVSQTSNTVTTNDTYDTTLINSLTVNVSGGGGGGTLVTVTKACSNANTCVKHLVPTVQQNHVYIGCLYGKSVSDFVTDQFVAFSLNGNDNQYTKGSGLRYRSGDINNCASTAASYDAKIEVGDQFMIYDFSVA